MDEHNYSECPLLIIPDYLHVHIHVYTYYNASLFHLLCLVEEYGTPIDVLSVPLCHSPGPRLWAEDALIALPAQFRVEERVVLVRLNRLKTTHTHL